MVEESGHLTSLRRRAEIPVCKRKLFAKKLNRSRLPTTYWYFARDRHQS